MNCNFSGANCKVRSENRDTWQFVQMCYIELVNNQVILGNLAWNQSWSNMWSWKENTLGYLKIKFHTWKG